MTVHRKRKKQKGKERNGKEKEEKERKRKKNKFNHKNNGHFSFLVKHLPKPMVVPKSQRTDGQENCSQ